MPSARIEKKKLEEKVKVVEKKVDEIMKEKKSRKADVFMVVTTVLSIVIAIVFGVFADRISKDSAPLKYEYEDISIGKVEKGKSVPFTVEESDNSYLSADLSINLKIETGQIDAMYVVYKENQTHLNPFRFELVNDSGVINSRSSPYLVDETISSIAEKIKIEQESEETPVDTYVYLLIKDANGKIYIDTIQAVGISRIQVEKQRLKIDDNDLDTYSFRVVKNNELVALSGSDSTKIKWIKEAEREIVNLDEVKIDWDKVEADINQLMGYYMKFEWQNITPN